MKKIFALTLLIVLLISLASCMNSNAQQADNQKTIESLEGEISALLAEQSQKDSERDSQIEQLREELSSLQKETQKNSEAQATEQTQKQEGFEYTVSDGMATVMGYNGRDRDIVIPSSIDGYRVVAIGERAFEDTLIKSVVIPDGVKSIGWFAFNGCMEMISATVPSSVAEIGYSAFGNPGSRLTLYCHDGSYVHSYAKSFGLTYTLV